MANNSLIIIGTGGHAKVVAASLQNLKLEAFVNENLKDLNQTFLGKPVYSSIEKIPDYQNKSVVVAIGDNKARAGFVKRFPKLNYVSVVHPTAWVHESVKIGRGAMIMAGVLIQPDTVLDEHVIVNTGAHIDHDCRVSSFVHLAPSSVLCGDCKVGTGTLVGASATLIPQMVVGEWCVVGAAAAVVKSIGDQAKATGVPAKVKSL